MAIDSFEFSGYKDTEFYLKMIDGLLIQQEKMDDINELCRAICCLCSVIPEKKDQIRRLLKLVHSNYQNINNQGYTDIWIALGRCGSTQEYNQ